MSIDLHIHSTYSDGTMSPCELIELAKKKGLRAISITDHDTVEGCVNQCYTDEGGDLELVPGVEIGAEFGGVTVHILGYFFDPGNAELEKKLQRVQNARNERNEQILLLLKKKGVSISDMELREMSRVGQTGRPHIAAILMKKGVVKTIDEAFLRFLRQGAAAYVPRFVYGVEEVFSMIRQAGGIAVIAHPMQLRRSGLDLGIAIRELVQYGLEGIEVYYPTHSKKTRIELKGYVDKYNLVMTGGSDYHGNIRPGTTLAGGKNVTVPYEILEKMKERAATSGNIKI
ncbi:MAG: PHP domain-containing protein [Deltaproteobacteria bacterium]|nr:PHP domain-containing protein [Deltaproteobacteria bacterium]MBW2659609.1 PHP domain-containing protein [Deltaproteobacteria bacterium]